MTDPPCQFLAWDTAFFGFRIAKLNSAVRTSAEMSDICRWCTDQRIRCLYYLAPSNDPDVPLIASQHAFALVDIRMTLEARLNAPIAPSPRIRRLKEEDLPALAAIARTAHTDSRFYYDSEFPRERCADLYEQWVAKSAQASVIGGSAERDSANAVFVADLDEKPAGYITCDRAGRTGQIGLLGVADWARGTGLGSELVSSALTFSDHNGLESVSVVTQGRNTAAQRLYQRQGFVTRSLELWYHRWFSID